MCTVRKSITLVLAVMLLTGIFSACGQPVKNEAGSTSKEATADGKTVSASTGEKGPELAKTWPEFNKKHRVEIVCFEEGWTGPEADKDIVTPEIAKRTNFELVYKPLTVSSDDELNQKLNLMVASKDVPDLFFGSSSDYSISIYNKLGEAGIIWDVSPYIKNYQSIYNLIKPEIIKYRVKGSTGGKSNYFIPTQTGKGNDLIHIACNGLYVREDFLKKLGMNYPTTYDEFYTYLKRCKDEIKEVNGKPIIGFTCGEDFDQLNMALGAGFYSTYVGSDNLQGFIFDTLNNYKMVNEEFADSPNVMKRSLFWNKLYREGLMDKEIITHKYVQYQEEVSSGRVAALGANWMDVNTFSDNAKTTIPDLMYVAPPSLTDKEGGNPKHLNNWTTPVLMYSTLTISKKLDEETMKHFLALLDYLATEDGQILTQAGIEGKSFSYNDKKQYVFNEDFKKNTAGLDWNKVAATGIFYWQQLVFNLPVIDKLRADYPEITREDNYKSWENKKWYRDLYKPDMMPTKDYYYTAGEVEQQYMPALLEAEKEFYVKVLLARNESEVANIVHEWGATCKKLNIDKIIAEREQRIKEIDISEY